MSEATEATTERPSLQELIEEGNGENVTVMIHGVQEATIYRYLREGFTQRVDRRERTSESWEKSSGKFYFTCDVELPWGRATMFTDDIA